MKKVFMTGILFGLAITIICGAVYLVFLHKVSGFGIGICFGLAFTTTYIKNHTKNKK